MPQQEINLDGSEERTIKAPANHNIAIQLRLVENDKVTPITITGDWKMVVAGNQMEKIFLSTDDSIVIAGNTLTINFSDLLHEFPPGTYSYDMRKDETGISARILHGPFIIIQTLAS